MSSTNCKESSSSSSSSPLNLLYLPDDLLLNCLARVSRLYYPTLSLVSKGFRSIIASTELYQTRTLLGCTESCLYVCLRFPHDSSPTHWFILCQRPIQNRNPNPNPRWFTSCFTPYRSLKNCTRKKEKKSSENFLVSIPTLRSPFLDCRVLIAVGCNIYKIGGYYNSSSRVFSMDCRSHKWSEAPRMRMAREYPLVSVLDGKIYVVECFKDFDSSNLIECFDPKTQKWEVVPSPGAEIHGTYAFSSVAMEGNLYLHGDQDVVFKPKENRWDKVTQMYLGMDPEFSCVIDNVLYFYGRTEKLKWYDFEGRSWRDLKGLKKLPKLLKGSNCVRLANYGGKIAVLWEKDVDEEKNIWCAEISLERRSGHEIYGKVEWCDVVLTVPGSCSVLNLLAVTV